MSISHHDSHETLLYFLMSLLKDHGGDLTSQVSYRRVTDETTGKDSWVLQVF